MSSGQNKTTNVIAFLESRQMNMQRECERVYPMDGLMQWVRQMALTGFALHWPLAKAHTLSLSLSLSLFLSLPHTHTNESAVPLHWVN